MLWLGGQGQAGDDSAQMVVHQYRTVAAQPVERDQSVLPDLLLRGQSCQVVVQASPVRLGGSDVVAPGTLVSRNQAKMSPTPL